MKVFEIAKKISVVVLVPLFLFSCGGGGDSNSNETQQPQQPEDSGNTSENQEDPVVNGPDIGAISPLYVTGYVPVSTTYSDGSGSTRNSTITYDGNRATVRANPSGDVVTVVLFDDNGRPTGLELNGELIAEYKYNAAGLFSRYEQPNGFFESYTYNSDQLPVRYTTTDNDFDVLYQSSNGQLVSATRDFSSNIKSEYEIQTNGNGLPTIINRYSVSTRNSGTTRTFTGRLEREYDSNGNQTRWTEYDADGNIGEASVTTYEVNTRGYADPGFFRSYDVTF